MGNEKETLWTQMPTEEEEKVNKLDYNSYTSPSIDNPDQGFVAAEAAKLLSPYIHNHVFDTPIAVKVPPPLTTQCLHSRLMCTFRSQGAFSCAPSCLEVRRHTLPSKPALGQPAPAEPAPVEPQPAPVEPPPVGRTRTAPLGQGVQREQSPPPPSPLPQKATGQTLSADNDDIYGEENPDDQEEGNLANAIHELEALEQEMGGGKPAANPRKRGRPPMGVAVPKKKAKAEERRRRIYYVDMAVLQNSVGIDHGVMVAHTAYRVIHVE